MEAAAWRASSGLNMSTLPSATPKINQEAHEAWLNRVSAAAYKFDFYQTMRRLACANPGLPLPGEALRPADEPVRLGQPAELDFAPAALHSLQRKAGSPPRLMQRAFGLLGSNGALPLHITEYTRERALHHGDTTLQRFLDTLTHRFALLFYRAWADAQPTVSLDRKDNRANFNRIGALVGIGLPSLQARDALADTSRLYFAGRLSRQTRDAAGLLAWCRIEFNVPVAVDQWCGHWMALARPERSRLGRREGALLGRGAVLGASVWDVQHKFRIVVGPLRLEQYQRFLPGGADLARLRAMVRSWVGLEFDWDLKLILHRDEVPRCELGARRVALGHTVWLGYYRRHRDADDLCMDVERTAATSIAPKDPSAPSDLPANAPLGAPMPA